jgi:Ser/Thr protein kinase RdoA (MazF antagonist)
VLRACIDDFDARVKPALPALRKQVIHADLNPDNVLTSQDDHIAGFIDFGDMLRAPLVMEVAIACSYLRPASNDAVLAWVNPFIAAYDRVLPLQEAERELLFDLLRARLVASLSILRWRAAVRGAEDAYSQQNLQGEADAASFLFRLNELGRGRFIDQVQKYIKNN